jgi:hypothetical protein
MSSSKFTPFQLYPRPGDRAHKVPRLNPTFLNISLEIAPAHEVYWHCKAPAACFRYPEGSFPAFFPDCRDSARDEELLLAMVLFLFTLAPIHFVDFINDLRRKYLPS